MNITILICTHNRADLLKRTLHFLNAAASPKGHEISILVAANACTDATEGLLRDYASTPGQLPLHWISVPEPGKSNALNRAIPLVNTPLSVFVDDDHRVDDQFLNAVTRTAEQYTDNDMFCGRIIPDWDGTEPSWVHDNGAYRIYPLPVPRYEQGTESHELTLEGPLPGGGNLFLRTELFARVGTFSTEFGPVGHNLGGAEDLQWVRRALKLGARLRYVPEVVQYHYVDAKRLRLPYLMHKAYERSSSTIRLSDERQSIPLFVYRKTADYLFNAIFCLRWDRRRFYLVRFAAALGELKGYLHRKKLQVEDSTKRDNPKTR